MSCNTQITSCNQFKRYIQSCDYYQPSTDAIQAFTSYIEKYQVTDNNFQCIINDIIAYSNYLIGKEGSNKNSSLLFKTCNSDKSIIQNLAIHIECFSYHRSETFYSLFLIFTANTLSTFSAKQRRSAYQHIIDQFDTIEQVTDDLDEYDQYDNNCSIVDELDIADSIQAFLFVEELKKATQLLSSIRDAQISYNQQVECKQIALSMFKLWNIYFDPNDECIEQITHLFHSMKPQNYIACRDIFTQSIMNKYLQFPIQQCLSIITSKMNQFVANEYSLDNYCGIGQIINRKLLPYIPILTHLISNNKLKVDNIKLIQMLFAVSIARGIPNILKIFTANNGNQETIHFDIALVFNQHIMKGIKQSIIRRSSKNCIITPPKRIRQNVYFKHSNYYNADNIYDHLFRNIIKALVKSKKDERSLIRVYIDMSQESTQFYPEVVVEIKKKQFVCNNQQIAPHLYSVLIARKRYESDVESGRGIIDNLKQKDEQTNNDLIVESEYMLLSNIIHPKEAKGGNAEYTTSMYLQYSLGIVRFMQEDVDKILPRFFDHGCKFVSKSNEVKGKHLEDRVYNELLEKFDKFQTNMQQ